MAALAKLILHHQVIVSKKEEITEEQKNIGEIRQNTAKSSGYKVL